MRLHELIVDLDCGSYGERHDISQSDIEIILKDLRACADALAPPEPQGWQDISTAPKDREVLLWWPYWSKRATVGYWKYDRWLAENALVDLTTSNALENGPSHWQALPAPPPPRADALEATRTHECKFNIADWKEHEVVGRRCSICGARERAAALDAAPSVEKAARQLLAEVRGLLGYEQSLRDLYGNTNIAVLKLRVDELGAALAADGGAVSRP